MAEEFVDLYQVLDLPIDADGNTVRKRINERYLDAQRNLDHRNFATRIKFQELFEVTLPQARYILLDDGRRDQYNRLVNAYRSPGGVPPGAPPVPSEPPPPLETLPETLPKTSSFSLQNASSTPSGTAPAIEPLPQTPLDPAQMAQEREDLWKKWKSGLEAALNVEESDQPKARSTVATAPTSFSLSPAPESLASQSQVVAQAQLQSAAPAATPVSPSTAAPPPAPVAAPPAPKAQERPKVKITFDFGPKEEAATPSPGIATAFASEEEAALSNAEMETRRTEHRRQITKEILVNVGLIWGIAGAALVVVPGLAALIATVAHYYPRGAPPLLGYPSIRLWIVGFLLIGAAAFFVSREMSQSMRRKKAQQLSLLSYEELLTQTSKS